MRYLIHARLKPLAAPKLLHALDSNTLGAGSIAGAEYASDMHAARWRDDGTVRWVETCFCATPLAEERPYWEEFFELLAVRDAHPRKNCRDFNGSEPWACCQCDCTKKLEASLAATGCGFLDKLREDAARPQ